MSDVFPSVYFSFDLVYGVFIAMYKFKILLVVALNQTFPWWLPCFAGQLFLKELMYLISFLVRWITGSYFLFSISQPSLTRSLRIIILSFINPLRISSWSYLSYSYFSSSFYQFLISKKHNKFKGVLYIEIPRLKIWIL